MTLLNMVAITAFPPLIRPQNTTDGDGPLAGLTGLSLQQMDVDLDDAFGIAQNGAPMPSAPPSPFALPSARPSPAPSGQGPLRTARLHPLPS